MSLLFIIPIYAPYSHIFIINAYSLNAPCSLLFILNAPMLSLLQTLCVMNTYATCRSEKYFERANEFLPERWLRDENPTGFKHHPFASLPFGYGTRSCIGKR